MAGRRSRPAASPAGRPNKEDFTQSAKPKALLRRGRGRGGRRPRGRKLKIFWKYKFEHSFRVQPVRAMNGGAMLKFSTVNENI